MHQNLATKIQKVLIERQFWQLTDIQLVLMINCTQIIKRSLCTSSNSSCTAILMRFVHTFYNLKSSFGESRKYTIFSPLLIEEMPIIQMKYSTINLACKDTHTHTHTKTCQISDKLNLRKKVWKLHVNYLALGKIHTLYGHCVVFTVRLSK